MKDEKHKRNIVLQKPEKAGVHIEQIPNRKSIRTEALEPSVSDSNLI